MRLSPSIEIIMSIAASEAIITNFNEIESEHLLIGILKFAEIDLASLAKNFPEVGSLDFLKKEVDDLHQILDENKINPKELRKKIRAEMGEGDIPFKGSVIHRSVEAKRIFMVAEELSVREKAMFIQPVHFFKVFLQHPGSRLAQILPGKSTGFETLGKTRLEVEEAPAKDVQAGLGQLTDAIKKLRRQLREKIFGQDHAINAFVEALFNAELVAAADDARRKPKGVLVFIGPPGVGKTFLAELGANALKRPFRRFDMSSFSSHEHIHSLIGWERSYKDSHPGLLTEFVEKNPNAILLFDEIEKANLDVIHLFLQILDVGILEDKFTEKGVSFKDAIIIFTTNAGKVLYEKPGATGMHVPRSNLHRKTIIDALRGEIDHRTGKPIFPEAICSRLATGYPILFNFLSISELERIAAAECQRMGLLMEKQYQKKISFAPLTYLCLVLREGLDSDARTIASQTEAFIKTEMLNFCQLYSPEKLDKILKNIDEIIFDLDPEDVLTNDVKKLLQSEEKANILLVADEGLTEIWPEHLKEINFKTASDIHDVINILENEEIDMVLLDLWVHQPDNGRRREPSSVKTVLQFDYVPASARGISLGQEILHAIHDKRPDCPCYLISFNKGKENQPAIDDELFLACVRTGGAQGVIETSFYSTDTSDWKMGLEELASTLKETWERIYRQKKANHMWAEKKILSFETAPMVQVEKKIIQIRLRNLRISRAMAAADLSEVVQEVERPSTRLADVYGADSAKAELDYIVKWLKDPRQFKSMGLKAPRGILLYGSPGTGKTMLARALAGECNVAFIVATATNFVTIWQGSGPQNVRDLFARGRRYAPAIVFIDELDAIGKRRMGGVGADAAAEQTLNALLTEMDGFFNLAQVKPVIVLAATNKVELLDDALRRRFDREIEVDKPDRAARLAYLKRRLQGSKHRQVTDEVITRLAGQSVNMTIAELERVIEMAGRIATSDKGVINDNIIEEAFERMRTGETKKETNPQTLLRIARHEAGHCLIGWLAGEKPVQVTIVARGKTGGFVEKESEENRMLYTMEELEQRIRQVMGGRAAEMVCYGARGGFTSGASSDLRMATYYAELMVKEYGMSEQIGHVVIDSNRLGDGPLAIEILKSVENIVKTQLDMAVNEIKAQRKYLDLIVDRLMEKNRLTTVELEEILGQIKIPGEKGD